MYNYISGTLAHSGKDLVVVDNHGIGWQIFVPTTVLAKLGSPGVDVKLYTYLAVREDDLQLYGFLSAEDLALFKLLISVSGVGPKAALGVLSTLSTAEFHLAVMHENVKALTRVPGIGPKSAKRVIVDLKEKVTALGTQINVPVSSAAHKTPDTFLDALDALLTLGYSGTEAQSVLQSVEGRETMTTEELLRKALTFLGTK
jgi:Holliday junction DNA helicase RuvA